MGWAARFESIFVQNIRTFYINFFTFSYGWGELVEGWHHSNRPTAPECIAWRVVLGDVHELWRSWASSLVMK